MTTVLVLEPPAPFINANHRAHFRARAELTKAWRQAAHEAAWHQAPDDHYASQVRITIAYRFADNRRREVQNLQPTSKAICDGIVDAGLLVDDSDDHVVGPDNRRERPNGTPRVTITIEEIS